MKLIRWVLFALLMGVASVSFAEPVNINTATAQELADAIKGVGPKKAEAIVAYRKEHGPFATIEDLENVAGIGKKTIDANRANLTVGPAKSAKSK